MDAATVFVSNTAEAPVIERKIVPSGGVSRGALALCVVGWCAPYTVLGSF